MNAPYTPKELAALCQSASPRLAGRAKLSWATAEEVLHQLHNEFKDDPLYLWMEMSFEEMADKVNKARFCGGEDMTRDQSRMRRQDAGGRVNHG
ncbi:MAG: hypothetical protein V4451_16210 [Pseudomonadota bacterium]